MIRFIKNYSLPTIKQKLLLLYILNVTDIVFTLLLLETGYFTEANIFLVKIIDIPSASVALKTLLPAILLLYIFMRLNKASEKQLKSSNIVIHVGIGIYALINLSHLLWFILLLFLQQA